MRVLHFYIVILFANVSHISTAMNWFRWHVQTTSDDNNTAASDSKAEESTANTLNDIPVHTLRLLPVPDIVSLSTVNKSMHQLISEKYTKLRAERVARGIITEVAREFGRYTSEEEIKESIKKPEEEPLLKWLYRVQRIHRMCFQIPNHFKATRNSLTRKENESGDDWLNRIESMLLEREALTVLYDNTNGINWRRKRKWKTDADICDWYGVTCTNGSVTELGLYENQLSGEIPKEIGQLTNLIVLRLYNNKLSGVIPKEIGQLKNLRSLHLDDNKLSGLIPSEIGQLSNLTYFYLRDNNLTGGIPKEIVHLTNLKVLRLTYNELTGSIPKGIGQLTNLEKLLLSYNNLSGTIPTEIGQLTKLKELFLGKNNLSGPIPEEIGQLTKLKYLYLHDNKLSGEIPKEIGRLTSLYKLSLSDNKLTGTIPSEIGRLTNLETLNFDRNNLSGSIPKEIGQLTNLKDLWLSYNNLSGSIPKEIGQLMQTHNLRANQSRPFSVIRRINDVIEENISLVVLVAAVGLLAVLARR